MAKTFIWQRGLCRQLHRSIIPQGAPEEPEYKNVHDFRSDLRCIQTYPSDLHHLFISATVLQFAQGTNRTISHSDVRLCGYRIRIHNRSIQTVFPGSHRRCQLLPGHQNGLKCTRIRVHTIANVAHIDEQHKHRHHLHGDIFRATFAFGLSRLWATRERCLQCYFAECRLLWIHLFGIAVIHVVACVYSAHRGHCYVHIVSEILEIGDRLDKYCHNYSIDYFVDGQFCLLVGVLVFVVLRLFECNGVYQFHMSAELLHFAQA